MMDMLGFQERKGLVFIGDANSPTDVLGIPYTSVLTTLDSVCMNNKQHILTSCVYS